MTVSVEIPSIFARYAGNRTSFECKGKTVGECIKELGKQYPDLAGLVLAADGSLLNSIDIFVNGESAYPRALARPVKDGDRLRIIMLIQGG
jgi:molybdopterin converting factor small subunit